MQVSNWTHTILTYGRLPVEKVYYNLIDDEQYEEVAKIKKAREFLTEYIDIDFTKDYGDVGKGLMVGQQFMPKDELMKLVEHKRKVIENELMAVL